MSTATDACMKPAEDRSSTHRRRGFATPAPPRSPPNAQPRIGVSQHAMSDDVAETVSHPDPNAENQDIIMEPDQHSSLDSKMAFAVRDHLPEDSISAIEACPYEAAQNLVAIGGKSETSIVYLSPDRISLRTSVLHGHEYTPSLSWHPLSTERNFRVAMATPECSVALFCSSSERDSTLDSTEYGMHDAFINSCVVTQDAIIATSDDRTCQEADIETQAVRTLFCLTSPGVNVRWRKSHPHLVLASELNGKIHLIDERQNQNDLCISSFRSPLLDADFNGQFVYAVSDSTWTTWDLRAAASPFREETSSQGRFERVRCSNSTPSIVATSSAQRLQIWDLSTTSAQVETQRTAIAGLSWHATKMMCVTGGDLHVYVWPLHRRRGKMQLFRAASLPNVPQQPVPLLSSRLYPDLNERLSSSRT